jgi:hypothetical protein
MKRLVFLKKPNIYWAFLFCMLGCLPASADFFSEQIKPVQTRAFDSTSQKLIISGLASTGLAQSQDSSFRDQYKDHQTMSESTASLGDKFGKYAIGPLIALGQLYWDPENGYAHARALAYTGVVTQVLKISLQRRRPNGSDHSSSPSGHTSTAFATATALTYSYGWKAGIWAYPLATFVGMSRMADDMHWFSDTVSGAFIGLWMGRASSYSTDEASKPSMLSNFRPVLQAGYQGLIFQTEF